mmetsp:Transcript_9260/g.27857  ORF Transcript_9260/g.27857 Transcript_9260/m.27857 type:complete len:398 (-) Transcript_9260:75-1268(-)
MLRALQKVPTLRGTLLRGVDRRLLPGPHCRLASSARKDGDVDGSASEQKAKETKSKGSAEKKQKVTAEDSAGGRDTSKEPERHSAQKGSDTKQEAVKADQVNGSGGKTETSQKSSEAEQASNDRRGDKKRQSERASKENGASHSEERHRTQESRMSSDAKKASENGKNKTEENPQKSPESTEASKNASQEPRLPLFRTFQYKMQSADTRSWIVDELVRRAMCSALRAKGIIVEGESRLKTLSKVWCVNRSVFAHGSHKDHFWMRIRRIQFKWKQDVLDYQDEPVLRHSGYRIAERLPGNVATHVVEEAPAVVGIPDMFLTIQRARFGSPKVHGRVKQAGALMRPETQTFVYEGYPGKGDILAGVTRKKDEETDDEDPTQDTNDDRGRDAVSKTRSED